VIVGCYSLHLYCRYYTDPACPHHLKGGQPEIFGTGCDNGAAARQQARKRGWELDLETWNATCPDCAKRLKAKPGGGR